MVKPVFTGEHKHLCDVAVGVPFTFYHFRDEHNPEDYEVYTKVENVRAIGRSYRKTAQKLENHQCAVTHTGTKRVTIVDKISRGYLVEYKEVKSVTVKPKKKRVSRS